VPWGINPAQQLETVRSDLLRQRRASRLPDWQAIVFKALPIALKPLWGDLRPQPLGNRYGQYVQRLPQGFAYAFQPVERAHGGQHMRGVSSRSSARLK
jgi:hypothetical protein